jgi:hypothetical protein
VNAVQAYALRVCIGLDAFIQAFFNMGVLGVTISSRIGTAAAHGHRWGLVGWWLLDRVWPFGRDKVTGRPHCKGAVISDLYRAQVLVVKELSDPVLTEYLKQFP